MARKGYAPVKGRWTCEDPDDERGDKPYSIVTEHGVLTAARRWPEATQTCMPIYVLKLVSFSHRQLAYATCQSGLRKPVLSGSRGAQKKFRAVLHHVAGADGLPEKLGRGADELVEMVQRAADN